MALAACRECAKEVSTEAPVCPHCGVPQPCAARGVGIRTIYCRTCGKPVNEKAEICLGCGTRPLSGRAQCQDCGAATTPNQEVCVKCGVRLKTLLATDERGVPIEPDFLGVSEYYRREFVKIHETNEAYKGKWNWAAFFFGPLWALTKGVWLAPVICFVAAMVTWGIGGMVYWFIFGARGNYMYYCAHAKHKQAPI